MGERYIPEEAQKWKAPKIELPSAAVVEQKPGADEDFRPSIFKVLKNRGLSRVLAIALSVGALAPAFVKAGEDVPGAEKSKISVVEKENKNPSAKVEFMGDEWEEVELNSALILGMRGYQI